MRNTIIISLISLLLLTGCKDGQPLPPRKEIDELSLIRVIAVDKCENPDHVKVTVTSEKAAGGGGDSSSNGGGGAGNEQIIVISAMQKTAQAVIRQFQLYTNKQVFWGHANFYLIGEDAAKEDIVRYLDFLSRDHDFRLDSEVYIVYGEAGDILEKSNIPGFFIADFFESISEKKKLLSVSGNIKMLQLMGELDENRTFGTVIPTISLDGELIKSKGTAFPLREAVQVEGYAIIKNFKLVGFINQEDSRGYNLIKNEANKGTIDIKDQTGKNIGMEIMGAHTKIIPKVENGQLVGVKIKSRIETNVDEIQSRQDVFTEDSLRYLEKQQSEVIKKEMEACVLIAKNLNTDFLGIGKTVRLKHPIIWNGIKDHWNVMFQELDIEVEVESSINRTYDIREPTGYKAGESH